MFKDVRLVALLQAVAQLVLIVLLLHLTKLLRCDQLTLKSPRLSLFLLQELSFALLFLFLLIIGLHQGLASLRLGLLCEFVREEVANERTCRLSLVRDHVVSADLRPILDTLEGVLRVASSIVQEELLDTGRLVLVLDVRLAGEQTDRTQLIADNEGFTIAAELAVQRIVSHISVYRIDSILTEALDDLLLLDVPENQRATITARHQELLEDWMRGQHPRVLFQLMAARPRQVVVKRLIHCVPNLNAAHLFLEFFRLHHIVLITCVLNLTRDAGDGKAAADRPLNCVALTLGKLDILANFTKANLATDGLFHWHILEVLCAILVEVGDRVGLDAPIFLVDRDN